MAHQNQQGRRKLGGSLNFFGVLRLAMQSLCLQPRGGGGFTAGSQKQLPNSRSKKCPRDSGQSASAFWGGLTGAVLCAVPGRTLTWLSSPGFRVSFLFLRISWFSAPPSRKLVSLHFPSGDVAGSTRTCPGVHGCCPKSMPRGSSWPDS